MSSDAPLTRRQLRELREAEQAETESQVGRPLSEQTVSQTVRSLSEGTETKGPRTADPSGDVSASDPVSSQSAAPPSLNDLPRKNTRLWVTLGVLAAASAGLAAVSLTAGPRLLDVRVDPAGAMQASGSRVILTLNEPVTAQPAAVQLTPEAPFTLDTAGRDLGIRFTVPLDADTDYTLRVDPVESGGNTSAVETSWRTPPTDFFVLQRQYGSRLDRIRPVTLADATAAPVFEHPMIIDFRATANRLVVAVQENDLSRLFAVDADGQNRRELPLPDPGMVNGLQVADRGGLIGYLFTDAGIGDTSQRGSVLVIESLETGEQRIVTVGGEEVNLQQWQFVPDSRSLMMVTFEGDLFVLDAGQADAEPQPIGSARDILGVSRGSAVAYIDRPDGLFAVNLETGDEQRMEYAQNETLAQLVALPNGSLQRIAERDTVGDPIAQRIALALDGDDPRTVVDVPMTDRIVQLCASPSGQYAAIVIAPDAANNPSDFTLLPLPELMETRIYDLRSDAFTQLATIEGFDASWCAVPPQY